MINFKELETIIVVIKVLRGRQLSSGEFEVWLDFLKTPPKLEMLGRDQAEAYLEKAKQLMKGYLAEK